MSIGRRRFWIGGLVIAAIALIVMSVVSLRRTKPVNILFITLDTTRADRLGCYGYAPAETPHLDALAKRGLLFERAYAPAPMTSPSHTSMLTGLWPKEHGVYTNGRFALEPSIPSATALLKQRGYDTAAFVAAFVLQAKFGLDQGFQIYDDDLSTAKPGGDELHRYRDGRYVVDSALQWLAKHHRKSAPSPFFCWVHLYDPHEPYLSHTQEFGDEFNDRPYDGELAYTDRQVGRLLDMLVKLNVADDTVIIVVGDHGESLGEHGEQTHGFMLHDSTLRVPLIVADPRLRLPGRRIATPVPLVDLFPTLLDLGGVDVPAGTSGLSLQPALDGQPLLPRICYSQTDEPYLQAFWSPLRGLTTERWRYVRTTKPELYDLISDPGELVNLADQLPEQVRQLDEDLAEFESRLKLRMGSQVALSAQEQRALESLGYAGGSSGAKDPSRDQSRPDIKDMIGYLNRLHQATDLLDERNYEAAAAILEPLAKDVPNFFRARLNLGQCRLRQENYEDAVHWFKAALEIDPTSDRALDMLGFSYLKLRRLDLAAENFLKLLELRPDSENGHLFMGEIHQRQGNFPLALRSYQTVLQLNPRNAAARQAVEALQQAGVRP